MNLKEYQESAKRTMTYLGSHELDTAHMLYGMMSEIVELMDAKDKVNAAEEIADVMWYVANYASINGIGFETIANVFEVNLDKIFGPVAKVDAINQLVCRISFLTDHEKKELAYKKHFPLVEKSMYLFEIIKTVNWCFYYFTINPYEALQHNIDKLRVRYPEKFSEEKALNRNLTEERKALEK